MNYQLLYQWEADIASHFPCLNTWQKANLALFSYGVIESEACQQQRLAKVINAHEKQESGKKRFRRFLANEAFPLEGFFQAWIVWLWKSLGLQRWHLLVDETKISNRMGVMVVALAWEGRAIPLIWRSYRANDAAAYPQEGQVGMIASLLSLIHGALPPEQVVLVMADRGIGTSPDLCRVIAQLGWYYLFRVTGQSKILTETGEYTIAQQVQMGEFWQAEGQIFKKRGRLSAKAMALWTEAYKEPWALVSNELEIEPETYAQRNWQEQSFRDLKSGGWHWGASRVRIAAHMDRLLCILVLAYAWMLAAGSQGICLDQGQTLHQASPIQTERNGPSKKQPRQQKPSEFKLRRQASLFKEGLSFFTECLKRHAIYLGLIFIPDKRFL